jgi:hypothetical protein
MFISWTPISSGLWGSPTVDSQSLNILTSNRTVIPIAVSDNSVQSTVTNNNSVQQTVIDLLPIMSNPRIALFSYSNINGNLTINLHSTNDKNLIYFSYG